MTAPTCNWCTESPVRAITTRLGDVPKAWEAEGKGRDTSQVVVVRACRSHLGNLVQVYSVDAPTLE